VNEIYFDTETMLLSSLRYVNNTRGYQVDGGVAVWANSDFIAQGIAAQRFDAVPVAPSILTASQKHNAEAPTFRVERAENIYGTQRRSFSGWIFAYTVNACPSKPNGISPKPTLAFWRRKAGMQNVLGYANRRRQTNSRHTSGNDRPTKAVNC
jgi:hypothetical protein